MHYGYCFRWTQFDGTVSEYRGELFDTREEADAAFEEHVHYMRLRGWKPPRWWQWWRVNDTNPKVRSALRSA